MTFDQQQNWDEAASSFDQESDHGLLDPSTRAAWRELLLRLLPGSPATVLDVGCSTGTLSVPHAEEGYRVHGIDLSPLVVEHARAKAAAAGVAVVFAEGDGTRPNVAPSSFDGVLCRHVLWTMPSPADAVAPWRRALRDGGRLLLIEGAWDTGAGLASEQVVSLLVPYSSDVNVFPLTNAVLWGRSISDERYAVVATI